VVDDATIFIRKCSEPKDIRNGFVIGVGDDVWAWHGVW
jgi:hypothetical protein